jgi:hypothetical protein
MGFAEFVTWTGHTRWLNLSYKLFAQRKPAWTSSG